MEGYLSIHLTVKKVSHDLRKGETQGCHKGLNWWPECLAIWPPVVSNVTERALSLEISKGG